MSGSGEDKPLPASEKKLRDAREKGQVPKSRDFVNAVVTLVAAGILVARADNTFAELKGLIESVGELWNQPSSEALAIISRQIFSAAANILAPLLILVVFSSILTNVVSTGGPVISMDPLIPKPEKLNPAQGLKNLVSLNGLLEVLKGVLKLTVIVIISANVIRGSLAALAQLPSCGLGCSAPLLRASLLMLLMESLLIFLVFGVADLGLQRWLFMRKQRMSLTEMKNEHKNTEGNPEIRRELNRQRKESSQIRAGLNQATFIVTGSRVAVAMRYSKVDTKVPISVAHAEADDVLDFMRDARPFKLPVVHDTATARALFDKVQIGKTIPQELFQAVINCMNRLDAAGQ
jgi:type III secretion protein U